MLGPPMKPYRVVLHPASWRKAQTYYERLQTQGLSSAGTFLREACRDALGADARGEALSALGPERFLELLVNTKRPMMFAESEVFGDGSDWNAAELSILGDIGVAVPVLAYDDGLHRHPRIHPTPVPATLLFTPGALLRADTGRTPADWDEVVDPARRSPELNVDGYRALYERRLLPLLAYASDVAGAAGRKALVTVPGLGCGQFSGPFNGKLGQQLEGALQALLERHAARLSHVRAVYFDPYAEGRNARYRIEHLELLVRPLKHGNADKPQLCEPSRYENAPATPADTDAQSAAPRDDFAQCQLFSMVAWDHVSWPGNDFFGNSRGTDDGVKAAATDSMWKLTGVEGQYNPKSYRYEPPSEYATWGEVVSRNGLRLSVAGNLSVLP